MFNHLRNCQLSSAAFKPYHQQGTRFTIHLQPWQNAIFHLLDFRYPSVCEWCFTEVLVCIFIITNVWMWELNCEESWALKNWCFWTVVLEKTPESPLDWKEIQPVHSEGDQPWDLFGRNDAKAETPVLWPPHAKSWLIGKDSDAGRDWGQEEKGTTEDEMAGWHHRLDGCEFEWTLGLMDREAWRAAIHGVAKSWTRLSDWTELNWMMLNTFSYTCWSFVYFIWINVYLSSSWSFCCLFWSFKKPGCHFLIELHELFFVLIIRQTHSRSWLINIFSFLWVYFFTLSITSSDILKILILMKSSSPTFSFDSNAFVDVTKKTIAKSNSEIFTVVFSLWDLWFLLLYRSLIYLELIFVYCVW